MRGDGIADALSLSALPHQVRIYHPDLNALSMTAILIKITDKTDSLSFPDCQPAPATR